MASRLYIKSEKCFYLTTNRETLCFLLETCFSLCNLTCVAGNFRELYDIISKSSEVLTKNGQHLDNVLETLELQQHSLGILAVLCAKFLLPNSNGNNPDAHKVLFSQVQEFIIGCNGEQVRFAPDMCKYANSFFTKLIGSSLCYNFYIAHSLSVLYVTLIKYILQTRSYVTCSRRA